MDIKGFIERSIADALTAYPDLFLLKSSYNESQGKYTFIVDGTEGFTIQQCGKISRYVMKQIEENESMEEARTTFSFEIASPGAESPLEDYRQYPKHIGRTVEVNKHDDSVVRGKLTYSDEKGIQLTQIIPSKVKGRRDKEGENIALLFDEIKESKIILSFN